MTAMPQPPLVPELQVVDLQRSLDFWCGLCGFRVEYTYPEERFAHLSRGAAQVMLEQDGLGRRWVTGSLDPPRGRGLNLQIVVDDVEPVLAALRAAGRPLFMEPETRRYRMWDQDVDVRQFLVTDPDGYLLRFQAPAPRLRP